MDYAPASSSRRFARPRSGSPREKLAPHYQKRAKQDRIDRAMLKEMGGLGLIGVDLPEQYGGLGESSATAGIVIEQIARWRFQRQLCAVAGVTDGRHDRAACLAGNRAAMAAAGDARRSHHRPRPDRAARRFGRRQSDSARRKIRQRLPAQRRKDLDELFRSMRRRRDLRAYRQRRGRRPRRQRLLCRSRPARHHPQRISTTSAPGRSAAARCSSTTCSFPPNA